MERHINGWLEKFFTEFVPLFPGEPITLLCGKAFLKHLLASGNMVQKGSLMFYTSEKNTEWEGGSITLVHHLTLDDSRVNGFLFPGTFYTIASLFPLIVRADSTLQRIDQNIVQEILKPVK